MLLIAKHDCVVEIKNDPPIGALQKTQFEFVETDRFEKDDDIVPSRFSQNAQPLSHARTSRRNDRRLDAEGGIIIQTIPQTQAGAGSVTMFNDTKDFHLIHCQESLFLQLPRPPFQRLDRALRAEALLQAASQAC